MGQEAFVAFRSAKGRVLPLVLEMKIQRDFALAEPVAHSKQL
jgi:hypothetical protein